VPASLLSDRTSQIAGLLVTAGLALLPAHGLASASPLALDTAMATARSNAQEVRAADARREAGQARLAAAKAYRLPRVTVSEIWMRTDLPAEAFALTLNQRRFSLDDFIEGDPNNPDPVTNATTRFELTLPIYTGGALTSRIEQAELAAGAGGEIARRTGDVAAAAAAEAWLRLAQARQGVELLEASMATVDAHVELASAYVEQGLLVSSELLRAQVERSRIADELASMRGMSRVAEANLAFRLGMLQSTSLNLAPLEDPEPVGESVDEFLAGAMTRADLMAARNMVRLTELEADTHRAARLPRIGLAARYDLNGEDLFGNDGEGSSVMAFASIDLFTGGRHKQAAGAARAEAAAAAADVAHFEEGVRLEIRRAWEEATVAIERLTTASAAIEAAREAERITDDRFRQGVVKMIDLLDISTARREAEIRALVARTEAHLAHVRLALAAGRAPETLLFPNPQPDHTGSSTATVDVAPALQVR